MKKITHLIWVGVGLILAFLIVSYREQVDNFFNSTSASNYLLIVLIAVDGLGNIFTYYMEKRDKTDEKREAHANLLIEKVFSKLADLNLIFDTADHRFDLGIPKPLDVIDEEEQYGDVSNFWNIPDLEKPYLDWALKHLEKYEEIEKLLPKLFELVKKHNESLDKAKELVKNQIRAMFAQHFSHIKEYDETNKIGYNSENMASVLCHHHYTESEDLPKEDPDDNYEWQVSCEATFKEYENKYHITGGYDYIFIICSKKDEVDIDKLNCLLTSLGHEANIRKEFNEIISIKKECDKNHTLFGEKMQLLIKELKSGVKLKGKCKLGY